MAIFTSFIPSDPILTINRHLGSISPMFYSKFLNAQIPNAKKRVRLSIFFTLLGSTSVKAASKTLVKLTPERG